MKTYKSLLVTSSLMHQMANEDFGPFEFFLYHTHTHVPGNQSNGDLTPASLIATLLPSSINLWIYKSIKLKKLHDAILGAVLIPGRKHNYIAPHSNESVQTK